MRSERVDTRRILADGYSDANGTNPDERRRELTAVRKYWPECLLDEASLLGAPWGTLVEPTRWADVDREAVCEYVREFAATNRYWPKVGVLRRQFGRVSNHRLLGEHPEQEILL